MWQPMTTFFTDNNYQVIAPDLRGFGESPMPSRKKDYKVELIVADLVQLLKSNNIKDPVYIMGHDWGAVIAWCFALAHPDLVKRAVAISVGHPKAYALAGWQQKIKGLYVLGFQLTGIAEHVLRKNNYKKLRQWGKQHPDINESIEFISRPGRLSAGLNYYRSNLISAFTNPWPNCKVPVLGIWSSDDSLLTEDQMTDSEKYMEAKWEYVRMQNIGHWIPLESPKQLFKIVHQWFQ
jgi:pimeloyl-ACP methyl ester carboxylesterase